MSLLFLKWFSIAASFGSLEHSVIINEVIINISGFIISFLNITLELCGRAHFARSEHERLVMFKFTQLDTYTQFGNLLY